MAIKLRNGIMKEFSFLKNSVVLWLVVILRFSSVLQAFFFLDTEVKPLEEVKKRQYKGRKWKVVLLIMIGVSLAFILISCGAKGPLYLPQNIHTNQQLIQNEN